MLKVSFNVYISVHTLNSATIYTPTLTRTQRQYIYKKKILFPDTFNFPASLHSSHMLTSYADNLTVKHPTQYLQVYVDCTIITCVKLYCFGYPLIFHGTFQLFLHLNWGSRVCGHLTDIRCVCC